MKKIGNILFLYFFVFIMCMGASFAWYAWKGNEVSVNVNFADLDPYIKYSSTKVNGGTITPSEDYTGGISNDITFNKEENGDNLNVYGHIYLKVTSAKSDNVFKASNLKWTLVSVSNNKETEISTGNFVGESVVSDNDPSKMIPANINFNLTKHSDNTTYKVYVWIDENSPMNIDISSQDISVETYVEANSYDTDSGKLDELHIREIIYKEGIITKVVGYSSIYNINAYMIVDSNTNPSSNDSGWISINNPSNIVTVNPNKTMNSINNICIKNENNEVYCKSIGKYSDEAGDKPSNTLCNNLTYNGEKQQLVSSTSGTGYTLKNYIGTNAGSYTITASLKDNYVWEDGTNDNVTFKCNIKQKDLTVKALDQTINYGETISQGLNMITSTGLVGKDSIASITLTPSTTEVTDSGTITPGVSAIFNSDGDDTMGNYNITYKTGKLVIKALSIENATVTLNPTSYTYDGSAKKPTVTVVLNNKTLVLDTDYSVSYSNNINPGTATVTVTGKGNYTGTKSINFTISYKTYTITLNNQSATSAGTTTLYGRYKDNIYLDNAYTKKMTTSANNITLPTKTGYAFLGYYTSANASGTQLIDKNGYITSAFTNSLYNSNVTLYAKWIAKKLTIVYNKNDGSSSSSSETFTWDGNMNDDYFAPTSSLNSRTGYTFKGWSKISDGSDNIRYSFNDSVGTDWFLSEVGNDEITKLNLYAIWEANTYTITYDYKNNIISGSDNWNYDSNSNPQIDYSYKFELGVATYSSSQWQGLRVPLSSNRKTNTNYKLSVAAYRTSDFSGNLRVYASTYDSSETLITYNHGISINTSNLLVSTWKEYSYSFNSGNYSFWPQINIDYDTAGQGPVYISAIRLDEYSTVSKTYGNTLGTLPTPTKLGYKFLGWYTEEDGGIKISSSTSVPSSNITYYAHWELDSFGLTVVPNGGTYGGSTSNRSITQDFGTLYGLSTPSRSNYDFNDWSLGNTDNGSLIRGSASGSATANGFTKSVKTDTDGSPYTNYTLNYTNSGTGNYYPNLHFSNYSYTSGHTYKLSYMLRVRKKTGFAYIHVRHSAFNNDWGSDFFKTESIELTDGWQEYTIYNTFTGTSTTLNGSTHNFNPCIEIYAAVTPGSTAVLDMDIKNLTIYDVNDKKYISNGMYDGYIYKFGSGDGSVSANWTRNSYTITTYYYYYYLNSSWTHFDTRTDTRTYGSTFAPYNVSAPTGYYAGNNFGYYDSSGNYIGDGTVGSNSFTVTGDMSVHVHYYPNSYYLDLNGHLDGSDSTGISGYGTADIYVNGSLVCDDCTDFYTQYPYGSTYEIKDIKSSSGHTYNGVYSGSLSGTINGGTGISLNFTTNTYTITFNANGGSGAPSSQSYTYNASGSITLSSTKPTRSGYNFLGWSTSSSGSPSYSAGGSFSTSVTSNTTLYAVWGLPTGINDYRNVLNSDTNDVYYITSCDSSNSGNCSYTSKNLENVSGSVARSTLGAYLDYESTIAYPVGNNQCSSSSCTVYMFTRTGVTSSTAAGNEIVGVLSLHKSSTTYPIYKTSTVSSNYRKVFFKYNTGTNIITNFTLSYYAYGAGTIQKLYFKTGDTYYFGGIPNSMVK